MNIAPISITCGTLRGTDWYELNMTSTYRDDAEKQKSIESDPERDTVSKISA